MFKSRRTASSAWGTRLCMRRRYEILWLTWKAYGLLIRLYPPDLREVYGDEMREVFRLQTLDAYEKGALELLRVLECAVVELFTCALPSWAQSPGAIVGATSLVTTSVIFLPLLWALQNPIALQHLGREISRGVFQAVR